MTPYLVFIAAIATDPILDDVAQGVAALVLAHKSFDRISDAQGARLVRGVNAWLRHHFPRYVAPAQGVCQPLCFHGDLIEWDEVYDARLTGCCFDHSQQPARD